MADRTFPELPAPPFARPTPIEIVAARTPLLSIREALSISIHEVVNSARYKAIALELYKVTRRMENEAWLRRRFAEAEYEAWIAAHL
jgi:hypothetical protein